MIARSEFFVRVGVAPESVARWVEAGWIRDAEEPGEADLARAALIRDLIERMDVNDPGVDVALSLLDQLNGLRLALRQVAVAIAALPPPVRKEALRALGRGRD